jgi:hypothetical protein
MRRRLLTPIRLGIRSLPASAVVVLVVVVAGLVVPVAAVVVAAVVVALLAVLVVALLAAALPEPKSSEFRELSRFNTRCASGTTGVFVYIGKHNCRAGSAAKR